MRQDGICKHKLRHHVVLGEMTDSGAGEDIQGEPEQLEVSESKEILERKSTKMGGACQRDIGAK